MLLTRRNRFLSSLSPPSVSRASPEEEDCSFLAVTGKGGHVQGKTVEGLSSASSLLAFKEGSVLRKVWFYLVNKSY